MRCGEAGGAAVFSGGSGRCGKGAMFEIRSVVMLEIRVGSLL